MSMIKNTLLPFICVLLVACGGGGSNDSDSTFNYYPVVDAGSTQYVSVGDQIILKASAFDRDGEIVWTNWLNRVGYPNVELNILSDTEASFIMPAEALNSSGVFVFEFSAVDEDGGESNDTVMIVVEEKLDLNNDLYAYQCCNWDIAQILLDCVANPRVEGFESCELSRLPLIGMDNPNPSVDDIMRRVLVTHDWMGDNFEELLESLPEEVLLLFRSATAIVIARDIRPSFYTALTGAIYIDPFYLWTKREQKAVIDNSEDFRSDYQKDLEFIAGGIYVVNGPDQRLAYNFYSLNNGDSRNFNELIMPAARLLFHELSHASDYFPPSEIGNLNLSDSILTAAAPATSEYLYVFYPLENQTLLELADVMFRGREATDAEKAITPLVYGQEFDSEYAVDDYAYSTPREDVATLFETTMMKYIYGVDRAFALYDKPTSQYPLSSEYVVRYGQFNRLGSTGVKPRAQLVAEQILPEIDWNTFFNNLEGQTDMTIGKSFARNITEY